MVSRFLTAGAGLAGALCVAAAGAAVAQQSKYSADDFANILKTQGGGGGGPEAAGGAAPPSGLADEFATILAPRMRTRSLVAGEGTEPGAPGSGVVPDLNIQFGSNSAELTGPAKATLDALAEAMSREELRELKFEVGGHTDAKGTDKYNQELSRKRANSVTAYLTRTKGVGTGRLKAVGYGESAPRDPKDPNSAVNRRVEVRTIE